jgi:hypothetical protein
MKNRFFILMMFFGGSIVFAQTGTINLGSGSYSIVTTPEAFVSAYKNKTLAVISLKAKDYSIVSGEIMNLCSRQNIDVTKVFDPTFVINAQTKQEYGMREVMNLLNGNVSSSNDNIYILTLENRETNGNLSIETEAQNIRAYFKYIARMWWPNQTDRWKECDSCHKSMNYGDGYCYGFYQAATDSYRVMRLWCDDCTEKSLQKHITGEISFDRDIVLQANNLANKR